MKALKDSYAKVLSARTAEYHCFRDCSVPMDESQFQPVISLSITQSMLHLDPGTYCSEGEL